MISVAHVLPDGTVKESFEMADGMTLEQAARTICPDSGGKFPAPVIAIVGSKPAVRELGDWDYPLGDGALVQFRQLALGGGGGGGSNPLQMVLQIAIIALAVAASVFTAGSSLFAAGGALAGMAGFLAMEQGGATHQYLVQIQHYLGVTGLNRAELAVFSAEMWRMIRLPIERDDALIHAMWDIARDFWERYVLTAIPPEADLAGNVNLPPLDPALARLDSPEWTTAAAAWREARAILKDAETYEKHCRAALVTLAQSTGKARVSGHSPVQHFRCQTPRQHSRGLAAHPAAQERVQSRLADFRPGCPVPHSLRLCRKRVGRFLATRLNKPRRSAQTTITWR